MDILLVVNPISGDQDKTDFLNFARYRFELKSIKAQIFETTGKNDVSEIKNILSKHSPEKIIIVGGDGTLSLLTPILKNFDISIGFIPMGSANAMAIEFGIDDFAENLLVKYIDSDNFFNTDLLLINDKYHLLHIGDVGANANLILKYENDDSRGLITYAKHFFSEFNNLSNFKAKIETENLSSEYSGVMLAICNGRKFGTGIALNNIGKLNDGKFEIVLIKAVDFTDLLKAALSSLSDETYDIDNFEVIQTNNANISFEKPILLQIDGEVVEKVSNLKIKVLTKVLKFIEID
ncbi:diacylglycerol/lipid kinase family protein [Psychroflexus aestuariivivens]|uniref:diacylglycerol/lipid kinase family protein n=1 Tax=Psychroflexus aestuariivivens TaxID=1795040 RepID=UPI000FD8DC2F|nr:diacylglycerol kinase family protein [Psychroflexus aestuariivivens]